MSVRVRFAPSPTGYLHIGGARTALFNYLFAKAQKGTFVLRIEDTDLERSSREYEQKQLEDLKWLGMDYDEGPGRPGTKGPYRQSERLDIYRKHARQLIDNGDAFYCFCTEEELERKKRAAKDAGDAPHYDGTCRNLPLEQAQKRMEEGESPTIRFKAPKKSFKFTDKVRGEIVFPEDMVGDFVILRSSGMPVYNFCCVVDDYLMEITHVIRGEDHLGNTLRQLMIYESLDAPIPQFAHVSLLVGKDRQKLSKRHGATSASYYRDSGHLPQAVVNYLCLLGWSHPEERDVFQLDELKDIFDLDRFTKAPALFDPEKLKWINGQHIRRLPLSELRKGVEQFVPGESAYRKQSREWQEVFLELFGPKLDFFKDVGGYLDDLFDPRPSVTESLQEIYSWESTTLIKEYLKGEIESIKAKGHEFASSEQFAVWEKHIKKELKIKGKFLFKGIRAVLTGMDHGADLKRLIPLTPVEVIQERLNRDFSGSDRIPVRIYNNLTRKKEKFTPLVDDRVLIYSCGPTTYDFLHTGNARALVVGDIIYRAFLTLGYNPVFVRNFTDVDDKIINRAREENIDPLKLSARYVDECKQDMRSLGVMPATHEPKVSETISEIIEMIRNLVDKGHAYEVAGEVLFHVPSFKGYGKLSGRNLDDLQHGIRVEVDSNKKHPGDFVLWKPAKDGETTFWDSPWGKGRPGWHIECSAMAKKFLGDQIDIHHGGIDLTFPHHENEIAQSEAANEGPFAKFWCHNEFVNFGDEKMSKSLGNVVTIREAVESYGGEVLRQVLCNSHYRSKMNWTGEVIEKAMHDVERIHKFIAGYKSAQKLNFSTDPLSGEDARAEGEIINDIKEHLQSMKDEIANDFNVPGMMSHFFNVLRDLNREFLDENNIFDKKRRLSPTLTKLIDEVISFIKDASGLIHDDEQGVLERLNLARKNLSDDSKEVSSEEVEELIQQRINARKDKNWKKADQIRDELNLMGIVLKDNPDGTVSWSYK